MKNMLLDEKSRVVLLLPNCPSEGSNELIKLVLKDQAGYKLTTEEIVDDGICCTVGIYEPV